MRKAILIAILVSLAPVAFATWGGFAGLVKSSSAAASTLVLEWLFSTGDNPTLDTSTYGNDGTVTSATWTTNAVGPHYWYYQDAVDDTIVSTVTQDKVTIELWATANSGNHWSHYVKAGTAEYVDGVASNWTEANYYTITGNVITQSLTTAGNIDTFRVHSVSNDAATVYSGYTNDLVSVMGLATAADLADTNLVASYHFSYPDGAGIGHDSSTNLNHGTYNGSEGQYTWTTNGTTYGAAGFDGVDDYMSVADDASLQFGTGDFTIAAWFRFDKTDSAYRAIASKGGIGAGEWLIQSLSSPSIGKMRFYADAGGILIDSTATYNDGAWHHIAVTRSGTTATMYLDGHAEVIEDTSAGDNLNTADNLSVGSRDDGADRLWDGQIDEVRIYNTALSSNEVNTIYQAGSGIYY